MNYKKIYNDLILRGQNRILKGYKESHHIIPRCLGGTDDIENLVDLTPEEHYLAHQLLVKIYPNNDKLIFAAAMMIPNRPSNKLYGWLRRKLSDTISISQSGQGNSQYNTRWIYNPTTSKSVKIQADDDIPDGWKLGRNAKEKLNICIKCNNTFLTSNYKIKLCSEKCKLYSKSRAIEIIDSNIDVIILLFSKTNSITKTLSEFGINGRAGNSYLSKILKERGFSVLKRRNT